MKETEVKYYSSFNISGINFTAYASPGGISKLSINSRRTEFPSYYVPVSYNDFRLFGIYDQLVEYFNGKRKEFNIPLDISGSEFQMKVWKALQKIPYGKTISYKILSENIGDLKAIRAVGKANGSNPVPIIIPCHRVINSDGSLGGFSCGIEIKEILLSLEGSLTLDLFG